jgi:HEAT repeat protein
MPPLSRDQHARKPKRNLAIALVPVLLVIITFLFWRQTWFGTRLSDREMREYLTDTSVPHKTQHALAQLAERMTRGDASARQWYPQVLALAANREAEFRLMAAWVMGQDNRSDDFHAALAKLLSDSDPMVRRNAALSLVRFGDASGRAELRAMLEAFPLRAPEAGTITFRLREGDPVRSGTAVARLASAASKPSDVVSPVVGEFTRREVADGATVATDDVVAEISPDEDQVWEALRALYLVGTTEDLADVEQFARGVSGMPDRIRQQAALTAAAIRHRAKTESP